MTSKTVSLGIEGMTCGGCVRNVTTALEAVPGVLSVTVTLDTKRAQVVADEGVADAALRTAVEEAGFDVID